MRSVLFAVVSSCLLGCSGLGNVLPDGGHGRVNCDTVSKLWPVEVIDLTGMPAGGADVTAINDANMSLKDSGKVDGRGIFRVDGAKVGTGPVTVRATLNGLSTNPGRFTFTPSECAGSLVEPRDLRLQLQR
jgi:hypothetical protein